MADTTSWASKRCCKRSKVAETVGFNKISSLPNEILCNILSSLPTKDAVRTTILSKRLSLAWTLLPNLKIDDSSFLTPYWKRNISPEIKSRFMDFVDRVLLLNDLQKLSLTCSRNYDRSRLSQWMSAADVEEFDLTFLKTQQFDFHPDHSGKQHVEFSINSKKLVILKLRDWGFRKNLIFSVPPSVYLPSLKILHLHLVHFCNDDSMKNLIDGCPVLEELYIMIDDNEEEEKQSKRIRLFRRPSFLKSLRVDTQYVCYNDIQLRINNLERERGYTKDDHVAVQYDVNSFSSLLKENLDRRRHSSTRKGTDDDHDSGLLEVISKLSNTKYLFVSRDILNCLLEPTRSDDLPMFLNLTHLVLQACDNYRWTDLPYSLESSPNLITFVFRKVEYRQQPWMQSQGLEWLMQNLEEIVLADFKGCSDELEICRCFLKSTILKKMTIKFYYPDLDKSKIVRKLLAMERSTCQVFIE